jgi:hypothetical protein
MTRQTSAHTGIHTHRRPSQALRATLIKLVCYLFGHHPQRPISEQGDYEQASCTDCGAQIHRKITISETNRWKTRK